MIRSAHLLTAKICPHIISVAALAVLGWEIISTSHLEYQHVWRAKKTVISGAYFVVRYWTLAALVGIVCLRFWVRIGDSADAVKVKSLWPVFPAQPEGQASASCRQFIRWGFYAPAVSYMFSGYIMITRVRALWGRKSLAIVPLWWVTMSRMTRFPG